MGFYYGSNQPPEEEPKGSWREVFMLIVATFRVLAVPLAVIFAAMLFFFVVIWLFTINALLGLAALLAVGAAIGVRALWEWRHPPTIEDIGRR
jgi:hypothetical protein